MLLRARRLAASPRRGRRRRGRRSCPARVLDARGAAPRPRRGARRRPRRPVRRRAARGPRRRRTRPDRSRWRSCSAGYAGALHRRRPPGGPGCGDAPPRRRARSPSSWLAARLLVGRRLVEPAAAGRVRIGRRATTRRRSTAATTSPTTTSGCRTRRGRAAIRRHDDDRPRSATRRLAAVHPRPPRPARSTGHVRAGDRAHRRRRRPARARRPPRDHSRSHPIPQRRPRSSRVVAYHGVPATGRRSERARAPAALGWQRLANGDVFVVSEPIGARTWFPANDQPADKATFAVRRRRARRVTRSRRTAG